MDFYILIQYQNAHTKQEQQSLLSNLILSWAETSPEYEMYRPAADYANSQPCSMFLFHTQMTHFSRFLSAYSKILSCQCCKSGTTGEC